MKSHRERLLFLAEKYWKIWNGSEMGEDRSLAHSALLDALDAAGIHYEDREHAATLAADFLKQPGILDVLLDAPKHVPDWLQIGALVSAAFAVGQVEDIAVSSKGRIMVLLLSLKGIWRNHPTEWVEYAPNLIHPATKEEIARDKDFYLGNLAEKQQAALKLAEVWICGN